MFSGNLSKCLESFLRIFEHVLRRRNQKNRTRWLRQDGNLRFGKLLVLSLCLKSLVRRDIVLKMLVLKHAAARLLLP